MPVYNYHCNNLKCDWRGDELVESYEVKFISCHKCGGQAEKQFTPGSTFHLKGYGWASDGYATAGSLAEASKRANEEARKKG